MRRCRFSPEVKFLTRIFARHSPPSLRCCVRARARARPFAVSSRLSSASIVRNEWSRMAWCGMTEDNNNNDINDNDNGGCNEQRTVVDSFVSRKCSSRCHLATVTAITESLSLLASMCRATPRHVYRVTTRVTR